MVRCSYFRAKLVIANDETMPPSACSDCLQVLRYVFTKFWNGEKLVCIYLIHVNHKNKRQRIYVF